MFRSYSIDLLLVYGNKYYLKVYLDICCYKVAEILKIACLNDNLFETDED